MDPKFFPGPLKPKSGEIGILVLDAARGSKVDKKTKKVTYNDGGHMEWTVCPGEDDHDCGVDCVKAALDARPIAQEARLETDGETTVTEIPAILGKSPRELALAWLVAREEREALENADKAVTLEKTEL